MAENERTDIITVKGSAKECELKFKSWKASLMKRRMADRVAGIHGRSQTVRRIDGRVAEVSCKNRTSQPAYDSTFEQEKRSWGTGFGKERSAHNGKQETRFLCRWWERIERSAFGVWFWRCSDAEYVSYTLPASQILRDVSMVRAV